MGLKRRYAMSCYWSISATHRHLLVGPGGDCQLLEGFQEDKDDEEDEVAIEGQDPDRLEADEAVVDEIARMPDAIIDVAAAKEDLSNARLSMSKVCVSG